MFVKQSKNTLILDILQILEKYSDVSHRLTQNDIISLLSRMISGDKTNSKYSENVYYSI